MIVLTEPQEQFIKNLARSKHGPRVRNLTRSNRVPKNYLNKTGQALLKLGLVSYVPLFGWTLTSEGIKQANILFSAGEEK